MYNADELEFRATKPHVPFLYVRLPNKARMHCEALINAIKDVRSFKHKARINRLEDHLFHNIVHYANNHIWPFAGIDRDELLVNAMLVALDGESKLIDETTRKINACYFSLYTNTSVGEEGPVFVLQDYKLPLAMHVNVANTLVRIKMSENPDMESELHFETLGAPYIGLVK